MSSNLFTLTGRTALVSGAAQGLGRAMSLALAEYGADLMLADRNSAGLHKTAEQITRLGRKAVPVTCEVSEPAQIRALFTELDRDFGPGVGRERRLGYFDLDGQRLEKVELKQRGRWQTHGGLVVKRMVH